MERKAKVIKFPKRQRIPSFESVSVLLSTIGSRTLDQQEAKQLCEAISAKIDYLETDLEKDAAVLRRGVESYVHTMAGGRQDELSGSGVHFRNMSSKSEVILESGEADRAEAKGKIDAIVEGCVAAARDDMKFLKSALKNIKEDRTLNDADLSKLKDILQGNTYWRFLEAT